MNIAEFKYEVFSDLLEGAIPDTWVPPAGLHAGCPLCRKVGSSRQTGAFIVDIAGVTSMKTGRSWVPKR